MAVLPLEVRELFEKVGAVTFCTANADGQPNAAVVGLKRIVDDSTIYLSDQFFLKTLANMQANPQVSILVWEGHEAYQIYGTARYVSEGDAEFAPMKAWADGIFAQMGRPITAKGGCFVSVDAVYQTSSGAGAGSRLA